MKNTLGSSITITLFGESHGPAVGVVIDGIAPGLDVDENVIAALLSRRRPSSSLDTPRQEKDNFQILSGVFNGKTTGTPVCISIPNENTKSKDYSYGLARPSHADYTANCKYHGFEDYRGGGHFSGRITAGIVAVGGIFIPALEKLGITIGTHILKCKDVQDIPFDTTSDSSIINAQIQTLKTSSFPVLNGAKEEEMAKVILSARENCDSVGGITQTAISGLMPGLGEPWFDSIESLINHAMFSLGGVKGIEFGKGFDFANENASTCNDAFRIENNRVITTTNNNGGINGGISNGMPVIFQCAVKPTPSIAQAQNTVDFCKSENAEIKIQGRHDPAIIRRICPVIDSLTAFVVCDLITQRFGTDFLARREI